MSTPAEAPGGEVLLYEAPDSQVRVDVRLEQDTVRLTQRQMSEIFETTPENVLMHLKNVFGDGELEEAATAKDFLVVQTEGNRQVRRAHLVEGYAVLHGPDNAAAKAAVECVNQKVTA